MSRKIILFILLCVLANSLGMTAAQTVEYTRPPWDGVSRFTVLMMGIDRRPDEPGGLAYRPDAVMVISFNPSTQSIGVLSIPREIHLAQVDTGDLVPVNTLLVRGEARQKDYGPIYMMDTVQYNLGIYIDTYVIVDFTAFIKLVDAIGGITVNATYPIYDPEFPDMTYGYDPFYLERGMHHFDGLTALKYARTRHSDNDYLRGQRQLEVLMAIRDKVLDPTTFVRLLPKAPTLMDELRDDIYTDITIDELVRLGQSALNLPPDAVTTGILDKDYSVLYTKPGGTPVRIPDREKLSGLLVEVFGENYWQ